ncbi:MAG: hypothetical protein AAF297_08940 [Planctomycetota bacterium]
MTNDDSSRLQRLEESLGFAQHESQSQAAELRELSRQVYELNQRTNRLEHRLRDALERLPTPSNLDADTNADATDTQTASDEQ